MRVNVTLEAVGELMMNLSTMRFTVTPLTLGNLSVTYVTVCTVKIAVLGVVGLELLINTCMAGTTDLVISILRVLKYILGTVRTMTYQAVLIGLALYVRLVTCKASRFHTVLGCINTGNVTSHTANLGIVLAWMVCHLLAFRIPVTYLTGYNLLALCIPDLLQHTLERNVQWIMRIGMTLQTVGEGISVFQAVTPGTLWHNLLVVILGGDVGMELGVTLQTVKPVLAAAVLQLYILVTVTGATLYRFDGYRLTLVKLIA